MVRDFGYVKCFCIFAGGKIPRFLNNQKKSGLLHFSKQKINGLIFPSKNSAIAKITEKQTLA